MGFFVLIISLYLGRVDEVLFAFLATPAPPSLKEQRSDIFTNVKVYTKQSLQYEMEENKSSTGSGKLLLLSVAGHVFDVSAGAKFYGEGGGYSFFVGGDYTRAFATGNFSREGRFFLYLCASVYSCAYKLLYFIHQLMLHALNTYLLSTQQTSMSGLVDNIDGFNDEQCHAIKEWLDFYNSHSKYKFVGVMEGLYFDTHGRETQYYKDFTKCAEFQPHEALWKFQPCNKRWTKDEGSTVSCPGVDTVPMQLVPNGIDVIDGLVCVCAEKDEKTGQVIDHGYKLIDVDACYPYMNKDGQMIRQASCQNEDNS